MNVVYAKNTATNFTSVINTDRELVITHIMEQHADDAAFLWLLRNNAVKQLNYDLKDLAELDVRIQANIDGLRLAGDAGWKLCEKALEYEEPGEVFTAAVLAFMSDDSIRVDKVVSKGAHTLENLNALVSSLGWLPFSDVEPWMHNMISANADPYRYLAVAAYAINRIDPGNALNSLINDSFPLIRARALRAVGELKRKDLLPELRHYFNDDDTDGRFWSAWSALLLGDHSAIEVLKQFFTPKSPYFEQTLQLVLRVMDVTTAHSWLQTLAQFPDTLRYVIQGAGIIGDPSYIPWLIKQMENEEAARVAGESFSMITGVDLASENMEGEWPEGFEVGPTENPENEDVDMDPDEDNPWPNVPVVSSWWDRNNQQFTEGVRYLAGKLITEDSCVNVLKTGYQRQRAAAALELAIIKPNQPLFEVRAPAVRQKKLLNC